MREITLDLTEDDREALRDPHGKRAGECYWGKTWIVDDDHEFEVRAYGGAPHEAHLDPVLVERARDGRLAGDVETFDVVDSVDEIRIELPALGVRIVGTSSPEPVPPVAP